MKVIKRDGVIQAFNFEKVKTAILKAFNAVKKEPSEKFFDQLEEQFNTLIAKNDKDYALSIEEIQEKILKYLFDKRQRDVYNAYSTYRDNRNKVRQLKTTTYKEAMKALKATAIKNQNANIDEASFGGRIGEASEVMTKDIALNYFMSKKSRLNHLNNEVYIHDLGCWVVGSHNCLSIPFDRLLKEGFNTRQTDVRAANSVNTAMQLVAVIFQLQSLQQFGGVSATHIDWTMVPYIRKSFFKYFKDGLKYIEGLSDEEIKEFEDDLCEK